MVVVLAAADSECSVAEAIEIVVVVVADISDSFFFPNAFFTLSTISPKIFARSFVVGASDEIIISATVVVDVVVVAIISSDDDDDTTHGDGQNAISNVTAIRRRG
jgi:hypothetical protein